MRCHACGVENPDSATTCYRCQAILSEPALESIASYAATGQMSNADLQSLIRAFYSLMSSKRQAFNRLLEIEKELKPLKDTGNSYDPIGSHQVSQDDIVAAQSSIIGLLAWYRKILNGMLKGFGCYTLLAFVLVVIFLQLIWTNVMAILDGATPLVVFANSLPYFFLVIPALLLFRAGRKNRNKLKKLESEKQEILNELWRFYDLRTNRAIPFEYSYPDTLETFFEIATTNHFTTLKDVINEFERQKRLGLLAQQNAAIRSSMISAGLILAAYVIDAATPDVVIKR